MLDLVGVMKKKKNNNQEILNFMENFLIFKCYLIFFLKTIWELNKLCPRTR